jgi:hypothetical protein
MPEPYQVAYRSFVDSDVPRPLLEITITGPNEEPQVLKGIVDSGADSSSFPHAWASVLGYSGKTLKSEHYMQASGPGVAHRAIEPCIASVIEVPGMDFKMYPQFIQGAEYVLWGRQDFFARFDVTFLESQEMFEITPYAQENSESSPHT